MEAQQRRFQGGADKSLMLVPAHVRPEDSLHVVALPYRLSPEDLDTPENAGRR